MYEKKKRIFSVDKISLRYVLRSSNSPLTYAIFHKYFILSIEAAASLHLACEGDLSQQTFSRSYWTWQTGKIDCDNVQTQTDCSSAPTGPHTHLWESLQNHRAVRVEVEDGEALHLLGDTAGLGDLQVGLPGEDGEHGGVVGRVLALGEREGAGARAVVGLVGERRDNGAIPPN